MAKYKAAAQMAREATRLRPTDNLALDAMDAKRAGMTYGKYKAQHPKTAAINEPRLAPKKKTATKQVYEYFCRYCGAKFTTNNFSVRYCSQDCKQKNDNARYRANRAKREAVKND